MPASCEALAGGAACATEFRDGVRGTPASVGQRPARLIVAHLFSRLSVKVSMSATKRVSNRSRCSRSAAGPSPPDCCSNSARRACRAAVKRLPPALLSFTRWARPIDRIGGAFDQPGSVQLSDMTRDRGDVEIGSTAARSVTRMVPARRQPS